jgi:hypothetical protein
LSDLTAATALVSMALASSAVPPACCANAVGENAMTAADTAATMSFRTVGFLPSRAAAF